MFTGRLQRLIVSVALVALFGGESHRIAAARAVRPPAGVSTGTVSVARPLARRVRRPSEEGCRVLPEPAPETPPAPATCS